MASAFHDKNATTKIDGYTNYVEYGKRFMKIVDEIKQELKTNRSVHA